MTAGIGATAWLLIFMFCLLLAVLWIALPFAVFGLKPMVRDLLNEHKRTNELLSALKERNS